MGADDDVAYSDPQEVEEMASTKLDTIGMDHHGTPLSLSVEGMRSRFERPLEQKDYLPHSFPVKAVAKGVVVFLPLRPNNSIRFVREEIPPFFAFFGLCWPRHGFSTACE